jgi:ubiquinol-cytochrome c reductase cytochrome b subunit
MGPYLTRLLGGGGSVGVVTFARFYGMHVLLLPPATILLIALHVFLVRKHGVAPAPGDELLPRKKFFPRAGFQGHGGDFRAFAILYTLALVARVPLEQLADPTDTNLHSASGMVFPVPVPDAEAVPGPLEVVGSVVLPGLAVLALILVPFLDRGRLVKVTKRTFAIGVVVLAAIGWGGLTATAVATTPKRRTAAESTIRRPPTGCSSRRRRWPASRTSARSAARVVTLPAMALRSWART